MNAVGKESLNKQKHCMIVGWRYNDIPRVILRLDTGRKLTI